jgi:hypothetical protein
MRTRKESARTPVDNDIQSFVKWLLSASRLKRGTDYLIGRSSVWLGKSPLRGKIVSILKSYYPQYNYYWENAQVLMWYIN